MRWVHPGTLAPPVLSSSWRKALHSFQSLIKGKVKERAGNSLAVQAVLDRNLQGATPLVTQEHSCNWRWQGKHWLTCSGTGWL